MDKHVKGILLIYIAIMITGIIALYKIPIEKIPEASFPRISVSTSWGGASPENVEFYITSVLESELAGLKDLQNISSYSYEGYSQITLEFSPKARMDFAYTRVNEILYQLKGELPEGVQYPQIVPYMPDEFEQEEVLSYGLYSKYLDKFELCKIIKDDIKPKISNMKGVSGVQLTGLVQREVKLFFNRKLLKSLGISVNFDIIPVIQNFRDICTLGELQNNNQNITLLLKSGFSSLNQIRKLPVKSYQNDKTYRLSDLCKISWDIAESNNSLFRLNGNEVVRLNIYKEPGTNVLALSKKVKNEMEKIFHQEEYSSIQYQILTDSSKEVKENLYNLTFRMVFTVLIILLVLLFFFRKWKPALVVITTIFFEVLITINVLYFTGQTLNYFTLSGFALAFGLLVDNAIVVYENSHKYLKTEFSYFEAIKKAIAEIRWAIIAATLTTICVFIPFIYLQKDIQVLLIPFAVTVGIALLSSIIVSMTFIPICLKIFSIEEGVEWGESKDNSKNRFSVYQSILRFFLNHRTIPVIIGLSLFGYALHLFISDVDKGSFFDFNYPDHINVIIYPPSNCKLETIDNIVKTFEKIIADAPQEKLKYYDAYISPKYGRIKIYFPEKVLQTSYPYVLREKLVVQSKYYAGVRVQVWGLGPLFYGGGGIYYKNFTLAGYNYLKLMDIAKNFAEKLKRNPRISTVRIGSYYGRQTKQLNVEIKKDLISQYNLSTTQVLGQIYTLLNKRKIGTITTLDNEYDIRITPEKEINLFDLKNSLLKISNRDLKLKEIANIELIKIPYRIKRKNQEYTLQIEYEYRGPYKLFEKFEETTLNFTHFPAGYHFAKEEHNFAGFNQFIKDTPGVIFILCLTLVLIYIILAILFESYLNPFVIMLTLPLAFVGVSFTFALFDLTFDSSAFIGTILLCGIVVNNAIIMINRINQIRINENKLDEAIIKGATERLRPILITSITTILGLMPFIIYTTESTGEDIWNILAYATVGGLFTATFFTLFLIPVFYNVIEGMKKIGRYYEN
ncbi:MAG: efflux RND transporter permease subunit [Candidatus Cloacimonadota bacterium]|nr:efflux RND transporter permease subunit [Candidatus Cloacimonadota bacterium]